VNDYEVTIIIQPQIEDSERDQLVTRVSDLLVPSGEKPTINVWGQRKMAYAIKKFTEGYYVHYEAKIDPARVRDIERTFQYNDDILRYLVIRKEA
jgi:small subunit ribosomal protein S6